MKNEKMTAEEMNAARFKLHMVMLKHVGPEKKIGMGELYQEVFGRTWKNRINDTKALRKFITEMRHDGQPIMSDSSTTSGGYWVAASSSEINHWCERAKGRALAILKRISKIKNVSLPDYLGQLHLDLGGGDDTK